MLYMYIGGDDLFVVCVIKVKNAPAGAPEYNYREDRARVI